MLVLVLVLAAGCGGSAKTIRVDALPQLVLSDADVGPAYTRFDFGRQLQADAQPGRTDPARFGREGGWIARFKKPRGPGPLVVESRADLFPSAHGARSDLVAYTALYFSESHSISRPRGLGQAAVAVQFVQGGGANALRTASVAWREQNVTASVVVQGFARSTSLADALRLAARQEQLLVRAER